MKNIDTSHLTPEQLANAEAMAEYTRSHECKQSFRVVSLAEDLLAALLESDHRPTPAAAFKIAIEYAEHATTQGEVYMQAEFEKWKAARPVVQDEVSDLDDEDLTEESSALLNAGPNPDDAITRDDAVADTERRAKELAGPSSIVEHFETDKGIVVVARTADTAVGGLVE